MKVSKVSRSLLVPQIYHNGTGGFLVMEMIIHMDIVILLK